MRQRVHQLIGAGFWLVMVVLWVVLVRQGKAPLAAVSRSVAYVALVAFAVLLVTGLWIGHNRRIYKRKGPRRGRPEQLPVTHEDRLGRPVQWLIVGGALGAATLQHLVVDVHDDTKSYRAG